MKTDFYASNGRRHWDRHRGAGLVALCLLSSGLRAEVNVYLTEVPDYEWHAGCFGTATGNLIGYWDRHGFPNMYTGPTAGGVAPLNSYSWNGNSGIRSLWASKAGQDGRPANKLGHEDDYYAGYESTVADPYQTAGRTEHAPDCIGDFIGLNQKRWTNLGGECDGNIDGFVYNYWDATGQRRVNYTPTTQAGVPAMDLQSGLRAWTSDRGYAADTVSQLSEFNPRITGPGPGFTYDDLVAEIDAGYPVLVFLQNWDELSRPIGNMPRANPEIHGMVAYGYLITDSGTRFVRVRNSWAEGDNQLRRWNTDTWLPLGYPYLPVRGLIRFHPAPKILSVEPKNGRLTVRWQGPDADLYDASAGTVRKVHGYVLERSASLTNPDFIPVTAPTTDHEATIENCCPGRAAFFRVRLVPAPN